MLASIGLWAVTVPPGDLMFTKDLVREIKMESQIPASLPSTVRDMPQATAEAIVKRSTQAQVQGYNLSVEVPAYYEDGTKGWAVQSYPIKWNNRFESTPEIKHYLIQEDPTSARAGKVTEMFASIGTSLGGWGKTDLIHELSKQKPNTHFYTNDQKYIQLNGKWFLAIPYGTGKWIGLNNDIVYSGVALVREENVEFVPRTSNRPDLEKYPIAPSSYVRSVFEGFNKRNVEGWYQDFFTTYVENEVVGTTNYADAEFNFLIGPNPGFYQGFEMVGKGSEIKFFAQVGGFKADTINYWDLKDSFSPDELIGTIGNAFVQRYNTVFGMNANQGYVQDVWSQVTINGDVWYYSFLIDKDKPEFYKGIMAINSHGTRVELDNPKSFMFIKAESGTFGPKLGEFISGKVVKADLFVPAGVVTNPSSQPAAQSSGGMTSQQATQLLEELRKTQAEIAQLRKELGTKNPK